MAHILPVPYFHVVFTVPEQLRLLIHRNRRVFFDLIFSAASGSLMTLAADPRHLGRPHRTHRGAPHLDARPELPSTSTHDRYRRRPHTGPKMARPQEPSLSLPGQ